MATGAKQNGVSTDTSETGLHRPKNDLVQCPPGPPSFVFTERRQRTTTTGPGAARSEADVVVVSERLVAREVVEFQANVPVEVSLAYGQGKIVEGRFGERVMYTLVGDRVMFLDMGVAQKINELGIHARQPLCICKHGAKKGQPAEWRVWAVDPRAGEQPDGTFRLPLGDRGAVSERASDAPAAGLTPLAVGSADVHGAHMGNITTDRNLLESGAAEPTAAPAAVALITPSRQAAPPANGSGHNSSTSKPPAASGKGNPPIATGWAQFLLSQTNDLVDVFGAALRYASERHGNQVKPEDVKSILLACYISYSKRGGPDVA